MSRTGLVIVVALLPLLIGCGAVALEPASSPVAPEACGFPDGMALSYAGRSTTATLGVQEVMGDPMSHQAADIYITRDKLEQGDRRGRLVCAIWVDHPGFVEVTVHPDDGGRFVPEPRHPPASAPPHGIAASEALDAALRALPEAEKWEVRVTEAGPLGTVLPMMRFQDWARDLPVDLWVWRVGFVRGDRSLDVVIDYVDGTVYGTAEYI